MNPKWQEGAWYTHIKYPGRRLQVTKVMGDMAAGYVYIGMGEFGKRPSWWAITLSPEDWDLCEVIAS
jgi:hypothetical protein